MIGEMVYPKNCTRATQIEFGFKVDVVTIYEKRPAFVGKDKHDKMMIELVENCTTILKESP